MGLPMTPLLLAGVQSYFFRRSTRPWKTSPPLRMELCRRGRRRAWSCRAEIHDGLRDLAAPEEA